MSETDEQKTTETQAADDSATKQAKQATNATATTARTEKSRVEQASPRRLSRAIVALVALVALIVIALLLWRYTTQRSAGQPVPAPRTVAMEQSSATDNTTSAPTDETITLPADAVARAGIALETVGEQLAPEGAAQAATGVVQANAYRVTPVVALVGGRVERVSAELGQNVRQGQTVAVVFSDELAQAQARYLAAQADLEEHHKHHQRTTQLVEIGAASREEFEQATTKLRMAEATVAAERQRLLLLGLTPERITALRSSAQISSEVSLPAPVAGTVISRAVNAGEVIEANKEILRVADLASVWVVGQVYEKDLARVRVGSGASVTSEAYAGRVWRGRVAYVDPQLDPATRTAQVRVELANTDRALKLGMYVNVAFATIGGAEQTAPVISTNAVQQLGAQQVVFVATNEPNVFALRPVRVGAEANGRVPVLEGLQVGERVVTQGSFMLRAEWLKLHPATTAQR
ncbi:MAG: hypothetical protein DMF64_20855 [Acidobacteria bacterium]|nr:MAG: hypothetical protein DMF64_20855 [Acidobacteriota bacterium]